MIKKILKGFWNIDIVGKMYIIIAVFIIIVTIATVVVRTQKGKEIQENNVTYQNVSSENAI